MTVIRVASSWWSGAYAAALMLYIALGLGCLPKEPPGSVFQDVRISEVPAPSGSYLAVAWITPGELLARYEQGPRVTGPIPFTYNLYLLALENGNLQLLDLPDYPSGCGRTEYGYTQVLSGRRALLTKVCQPKIPKDQFLSSDLRLVVWNSHTGEMTEPFDYPFPTSMGTIVLSDDLAHAVLSMGGKLYWLEDIGHREIDLGMEEALLPTWSPNGREIVFWGNKTVGKRSGPSYAPRPDGLWRMDISCVEAGASCREAPKEILRDVVDGSVISWSQDGEWLTFRGEINRIRTIWLLRVRDGLLLRIPDLGVVLYSPSWSPDGKRIAVTGHAPEQDPTDHTRRVYVLDVADRP
jgi:hypothetical protein